MVLDASVAAKWTFPLSTEPLLAEANRLLAEYLSDRLQFIVPDLFWAEIGSVLRKAVLQRKTSEMEAQLALALAREAPEAKTRGRTASDACQAGPLGGQGRPHPLADGPYCSIKIRPRISPLG